MTRSLRENNMLKIWATNFGVVILWSDMTLWDAETGVFAGEICDYQLLNGVFKITLKTSRKSYIELSVNIGSIQ